LIAEITGVLGVYGGKEMVVDYVNGDRASYVGTLFRGRVIGGTLQPDNQEILDLRYFSREEMERIPHARWMDIAVNAIFSMPASADFQPATWRP
jgi:hypothetical protein